MTNAETIYRAMLLMVRVSPVTRLEWGKLRIDHYPLSNTHAWFGPKGRINKQEVLSVISKTLGE